MSAHTHLGCTESPKQSITNANTLCNCGDPYSHRSKVADYGKKKPSLITKINSCVSSKIQLYALEKSIVERTNVRKTKEITQSQAN